MLKKINTIIFDLDGTLINTSKDIVNSTNLTLEKFGYEPISTERCIEFVGDGIIKQVGRAFGESKFNNPDHQFSLEYLNSIVETYLEIYKVHLYDYSLPYDGVFEIFKKFSNKKLAVISNKHYDYTFELLKHFQMDKYFSIILGGDSLEHKKPHPEPIIHVIKELNIKPTETIIVGDTDKDVRAGKAAGISTCAVTYGMRTKAELENHNPEFMIDNISELLKIID